MDWKDLANKQRTAATVLSRLTDGERPCCSRAYYAAYSMVTHHLEPLNLTYAHGWQNPAHADLTKHVSNIPGLGDASKRAVRRALRRLRQRREDADYRPRQTIDGRAVRESLRDVAEVFRIFGEARES